MNQAVKRRVDWSLITLLTPATLLMVLVFLVPFILLLVTSFWRFVPGTYIPQITFTLENYVRVVTDPYFISVYKETIYISFTATAITFLLGYPLARLISQQKTGLKGLLFVLVTLPMIGGAMIQTLGWETLLIRYGAINDLLQLFGIIHHPITFLGNEGGIIIGLVQSFLPLMVIPLASSLAAIDKSMEDAAASLGANAVRVFFEVIFPLSLPGAIAGTILVLMANLTSFVTPSMLGQGGIQVFGTMAYQQAIMVMNWPFSSAFAMFFIFSAAVIAFLVYLLSRLFTKRRV
jgi:putative spermidine/putrescine transport system permease protein